MGTIDGDSLAKTVQKFLADQPLLVLGSGASAPYGLPTVYDLAEAIASDEVVASFEEAACLVAKLNEGTNLESAINDSAVSDELMNRIRFIIWEKIQASDKRHLLTAIGAQPTPLEIALGKILGTAARKACIVTTNYDRLAEVAIDKIGATCVDGFYGHILREFNLDFSSARVITTKRREMVVDLWKVHGSIDWFRCPDGTMVSAPSCDEVPVGCEPLIVPPSKSKYAETSQDPYRGIISQADAAFETARSYLCVGYGFGDEHIHPYLEREAERGKPIVILARTLTNACRRWLEEAKLRRFVALEMDHMGNEKTHVMMNDGESEQFDCVVDGSYWDIKELVKIW